MQPYQQGGSQLPKKSVPKQGSSGWGSGQGDGWGDGWGDNSLNNNFFPGINAQLKHYKSEQLTQKPGWGQQQQTKNNQGWGQQGGNHGWEQHRKGGDGNSGWGQHGGNPQGGNQGWGNQQGGGNQGNQGWGNQQGGNQGNQGWGNQQGGNQGSGSQGGSNNSWEHGNNQYGFEGPPKIPGPLGGTSSQGLENLFLFQGKPNQIGQKKATSQGSGQDIFNSQQNSQSLWNNQLFQKGFGQQLINFKAGEKYQANLASHSRCKTRVMNMGFSQTENNTPILNSIGSIHLQPLASIGIILPTLFPNPNIKYKILSVLDLKMCLDATTTHNPNKKLFKGNMTLWEYHGGPNQQYYIKTSGKFCRIYSAATGFTLRVPNKVDKNNKIIPNSSNENQIQLRVNPSQDIQSELFQFVQKEIGKQSYYMIKTYCGKAIDVAGGKKKNNTSIIQYEVNEKENQMWKITPA